MPERIPSSYNDLREFIAFLDKRGQLRRIKAPVSSDLDQLPILKCWPEDDRSFITLPMVIRRDPLRGTRNVGMYRIQVYDRNTAGMHWQIHKGGTEHQRRALEQGQRRMDVAVALGGS